MGFADRFRDMFSKRGNPELAKLELWATGRKGLEGYIEPKTATVPTTLLLVDRDGKFARSPLRDPEEGARFCRRHSIPVYDAQVMGYPDRMQGRPRREEAEIIGDVDATFAELEKRLRETPTEDDR